MAGGMREVGVEAVVKNLNGFLGDMRRMNKSVSDFGDKVLDIGVWLSRMGTEQFSDGILEITGALQSGSPYLSAALFAFKKLGDEINRLGSDIKTGVVTAINLAVGAFNLLKNTLTTLISVALKPVQAVFNAVTGTLRRIWEIASGILLANTIRRLGQVISDAGTQALEAAINFQTLEVRLMGLAARQILNTGEIEDFGAALEVASGKAGELLEWVIDLSLKAPLSTDAIANTLTLATSYGLAEDKAKDMTTAVLTFASGMGLTDVAQRRIIENFGQMIQQGKITSQELRDMGRGAFVPVNDLLNRTAELLGMTADQFDGTAGSINEFARKAGLDPTMAIMQAFIEMTQEEFPGAIERMGATISGLRQRFTNLIDSIVGLNMLKPTLDLLGQTIGKVFDKIAESEQIKALSIRIGESLQTIVTNVLNNMPTIEEIVLKIEQAFRSVSMAMAQFAQGNFLEGLRALGVPESLISFIDKLQNFQNTEVGLFLQGVIDKFTKIRDFWNENKDVILEALRIAAGDILDALGIDTSFLETEDPLDNFIRFKETAGEEWDVQPILDAIDGISTSIINVITWIGELPGKIESLKPAFLVLAGLFLMLRYPILSTMGLFLTLPAVLASAIGRAIAAVIQGLPGFLKAGADLAAGLINGFADWWNTKAIPWLKGLFDRVVGSLGPLGDWLESKGFGKNLVAQRPPTSTTTSSESITNYNINVNAAYPQAQSPASISADLGVLLGRLE